VYEFNFGMGFMREINKKIGVPVDGLPDVKKNMGLQYTVAGIMDGDLEALVDALDVANKGRVPRVTKEILDNYIDDPETDIDKLFAEVLDFLKKANATKKTVETLLEAIEAEKQKQMNQ
jgi:hypothetical protein